MIRILFVDDESMILDGLARSLFSRRRQWKMEFAVGPKEALAVFETNEFDVVVSDMRMPFMDGAELLAEIRKQSPQTIRCILSGHADSADVIRSVLHAHRFFSKPANAQTLGVAIDGIVAAQEQIPDLTIRNALVGLGSLSMASSTVEHVSKALANDDINEAVAGAEQDLAFGVQILHLANFGFFQPGMPVTDIAQAVRILGLDQLRELMGQIISHTSVVPAPLEGGFLSGEPLARSIGRVAVHVAELGGGDWTDSHLEEAGTFLLHLWGALPG